MIHIEAAHCVYISGWFAGSASLSAYIENDEITLIESASRPDLRDSEIDAAQAFTIWIPDGYVGSGRTCTLQVDDNVKSVVIPESLPELEFHVDAIRGSTVVGWAVWHSDGVRLTRIPLTLLLGTGDGVRPIDIRVRDDLKAAGIGDGQFSFEVDAGGQRHLLCSAVHPFIPHTTTIRVDTWTGESRVESHDMVLADNKVPINAPGGGTPPVNPVNEARVFPFPRSFHDEFPQKVAPRRTADNWAGEIEWYRGRRLTMDAMRVADEAINVHPENPNLLATIAGLYSDLGEYRLSAAYAGKAWSAKRGYTKALERGIMSALMSAGRPGVVDWIGRHGVRSLRGMSEANRRKLWAGGVITRFALQRLAPPEKALTDVFVRVPGFDKESYSFFPTSRGLLYSGPKNLVFPEDAWLASMSFRFAGEINGIMSNDLADLIVSACHYVQYSRVASSILLVANNSDKFGYISSVTVAEHKRSVDQSNWIILLTDVDG